MDTRRLIQSWIRRPAVSCLFLGSSFTFLACSGLPWVGPHGPAERAGIERMLGTYAPRLESHERARVARAVVRAQRQHGLDPLLALAVMWRESRFDSRAIGPNHSLGLMQLKPATAREVAARLGIPWRGSNMLFDPEHNVRLGCAYLAQQLAAFGRRELALAAYNLGPTHVRGLLARGEQPRSAYAIQVLKEYERLRRRYPRLAALRS